jgi:hypothetical protein
MEQNELGKSLRGMISRRYDSRSHSLPIKCGLRQGRLNALQSYPCAPVVICGTCHGYDIINANYVASSGIILQRPNSLCITAIVTHSNNAWV